MPTSNAQKAVAFVRGAASGDVDLVLAGIDRDGYVEHDSARVDGRAGSTDLERRILETTRSNPTVEILRVLSDGAFVVVQSRTSAPGGTVDFEVFGFRDDRIAERWVYSSADAPPNRSGHTQADGPSSPQDGADAEQNKAIVRDYYETVHLSGRRDQAQRWFNGNHMVRHEPGVADGVSEFLRDLDVLVRNRTIDEIDILLGEGDFVFLTATGTHEDDPCAYVDLYRVEDDKLVEHWGFPQSMPGRRQHADGS